MGLQPVLQKPARLDCIAHIVETFKTGDRDLPAANPKAYLLLLAFDFVNYVPCRKKRKWDVPGTAPAQLRATTPSILGQPFGTAPGHVAVLQNMPHVGMPQPGPAGVPGSSAAEEIRKKINQVRALH